MSLLAEVESQQQEMQAIKRRLDQHSAAFTQLATAVKDVADKIQAYFSNVDDNSKQQ